MTRANLNFVYQRHGEAPRTLFYYYNGDQYPSGLRDHFNILDFVLNDFTPAGFKKWIAKNYYEKRRMKGTNPKTGFSVEFDEITDVPAKPENLGEGGQPKIFYTDGFITDYSYVFDTNHGDPKILVYEWAKLIFEGSPKCFEKWLKKQK